MTETQGAALQQAPKLLVVDDTPQNVKLLADILAACRDHA